MTLIDPNQKSWLVAMMQADAQTSDELAQAHKEHASVLQTLGESVQSSFVELSTQNESLRKEVISLRAQSVTKDAAHEAALKAMKELFETLQKGNQELIQRLDITQNKLTDAMSEIAQLRTSNSSLESKVEKLTESMRGVVLKSWSRS